MAKPMQIDFVSDVVCPWCAVGLASLETALQRLEGEIAAEIRFQPFELNPDMPQEGEDRDEHIARKSGRSQDETYAVRETIRERAAAVGFTMSPAQKRIYNSFDAHRLLHWAGLVDRPKKRPAGGETPKGERQAALKHALLRAYFTEGLNIADPAVLVAQAEAAGLDPAEARTILASDRYAQDVKLEEQAWLATGINSVPAIVVNRTYLISGGQPPDVFETHLREMAKRED
jgi:predicted DsbA family dithiol-disulfide isomerase